MAPQNDNWLKPEEALTRFKKPQASLLAENEVDLNSKTHRYGFIINNIGFLIDDSTLAEVVKNARVFPVPNTKEWLKGLINLRGNLVPVYDLPIMTGLVEESYGNENLIVLGSGVNSVAIVLEKLPKSCEVSQWEKMDKVPCGLNGLEEYVTEVYTAENKVWINFDESKYFESVKSQVNL